MMIKSDVNKFNQPMYILFPGDYFATRENCIVGTVTGACVAVCFFDARRKIGGMGHFIVPGSMGTEGIVSDEIARKGIVSMEYLMGEIVKLGGDRKDLICKVFGAGYNEKNDAAVSGSNIRFIQEYFSLEKITVERSDLGGSFRRRIYFSISDGTVYRQILKNNESASEFVQLEREYIDTEFRNRKRTGRILLFE